MPGKKVFKSHTIIDDTLLCSNNISILFYYFSSVCQVFNKYHLYSKLNTRILFKPRAKYIGYDHKADCNYPAAFTLDMIK